MKNKKAEKVYKLVRNIPKGKVLTYKALAQLAGISSSFHLVTIVTNSQPKFVLL